VRLLPAIASRSGEAGGCVDLACRGEARQSEDGRLIKLSDSVVNNSLYLSRIDALDKNTIILK
jgi:hypothetical protein